MTTMISSFDTISSSSDFVTPPSTPRRAHVGLGFDFAIRTSLSSASSSSSVALRSHWSSDSSLANSPLPPSPPSPTSSISPPLVPFSTCDNDEGVDGGELECDNEFGSSFLPAALPSYSGVAGGDTKATCLLPSATISESRAQFQPFYHDASQQAFACAAPSEPFARDACRKRRLSSSPLEPNSPAKRGAKRFRQSPALQNLSIFTKAAMAEQADLWIREVNAMDNLAIMHVDETSEVDAIDLPCRRKVDLTVLVSDLPAGSPYPPTPRSTSLPPLTFSSSVPPTARFPYLPYSPSFGQEIKVDIGRRLGLAGLGITLDDIDVYPSSSPSCGSEAAQRYTVVLHTAATA